MIHIGNSRERTSNISLKTDNQLPLSSALEVLAKYIEKIIVAGARLG